MITFKFLVQFDLFGFDAEPSTEEQEQIGESLLAKVREAVNAADFENFLMFSVTEA